MTDQRNYEEPARPGVIHSAKVLAEWMDEIETGLHLDYLMAAWNEMLAGGNCDVDDARRVVKAAIKAIADHGNK